MWRTHKKSCMSGVVMSLNGYDKFFLSGVMAGTFTAGGLIGSLALSNTFNAATYITYGVLTAAGAAIGAEYFNNKFTPKEVEEKKDPWVREQDRVLTEAEQTEIFKQFMKKSMTIMGGFFLGAAGGILAGYLTMSAVDHIKAPADTGAEQRPAAVRLDYRP